MIGKKSKSNKSVATKKVRQKKLPVPGSSIHKSMVLSGKIKEKKE
mgnify:CR=1 FL=1